MTDQGLRVALIEPVGGHGGMEAYDLGLALGLKAAGGQPILYTSEARADGDQPIERTFAGVYGRAPAPWRALKFLLAYRRTLADASSRGVRIAHLHFFRASLLERFSVHAVRRQGLAVVATAHDVQSLGESDRPAVASRLYGAVDRVIVHNLASRDELERLVPGIRPDVVPHGNYLHHLGPSIERQEARRLLDLPAEAPIALFFGQLKRVKGLDLLLEAMAQVVKDLPTARLLVAGRAWKDDPTRYLELAQELDIASHVDMRHGFVPEELVPAHFAAADLVVLPYRRVYQSGVLLLAMSYQRPVLVADLPAMLETVEDDASGFTFRSNDAADLASRLVSLLPASDRLDRTARRGYEQVRRNNDWRDIGRQTLATYRRTL